MPRRSREDEPILNEGIVVLTLLWLLVTGSGIYQSVTQGKPLEWKTFFPFPDWLTYLILFVWFVAILVLLVNRWRDKRRLKSVRSINEMLALSPTEFEDMVAEIYRARKCRVEHRGGPGDKGVDLMVTDPKGYRHVVQCKRYKGRINRAHIDELDSVVGSEGAIGGILVTTGQASPEVHRRAKEKGVVIIDGTKLVQWKEKYLPAHAV
jgi:HJR/Mrr/RecB family endonuclease